MAFPVVVTPVAEQGANEWARQRPKKHFALEENPVLVDVSAREASFYEGEIAWGMVYNRFRRLVITEYLVAPLESE